MQGKSLGNVSDAVGEYLHVYFAIAWPIKFGEENALPPAECQLPFLDENELVYVSEYGFHVRIGIALGVAIGAGHGDEAIESSLSIGGYVRVGMLVDQNAGGGVRDVYEAGANANPESGHDALHIFGDVNELGAARSLYGDGLHKVLERLAEPE
jgi:hypothetical protein